nr:MAG TPA: major tail protein [Caudoviricetes sp.]
MNTANRSSRPPPDTSRKPGQAYDRLPEGQGIRPPARRRDPRMGRVYGWHRASRQNPAMGRHRTDGNQPNAHGKPIHRPAHRQTRHPHRGQKPDKRRHARITPHGKARRSPLRHAGTISAHRRRGHRQHPKRPDRPGHRHAIHDARAHVAGRLAGNTMKGNTMQKVPAHLGDGEFRTIMVEESGIKNYLKPTASELNSGSSLDLSPYLSATGWHLTHSQDMVDDDRESSATVGQIPGQEKFSDGSMDLIDNVNTSDAANFNKAVDTLTCGKRCWIVRRRGKTVDAPFVAGDVISVYLVTIGIKIPVAHSINSRQMSTINFSADPCSKEETITVA